MSRPEDWTKTLNNLATLMQHDVLTLEQAKEQFAYIHGFYPDTGEPYRSPKPQRPWWRFW